jgi:hypothetical protein
MKAPRPSSRQPVSVEIDGQTYDGTFAAHARMITVWYAGQSNATHLLGSACEPEALARILLGELARERRDRS